MGIEEIWFEWAEVDQVRSIECLVAVRRVAAALDIMRPSRPRRRKTRVAGCHRRCGAAHAGYLRSNVESDVGGNHLVKNLKALVGAVCS